MEIITNRLTDLIIHCYPHTRDSRGTGSCSCYKIDMKDGLWECRITLKINDLKLYQDLITALTMDTTIHCSAWTDLEYVKRYCTMTERISPIEEYIPKIEKYGRKNEEILLQFNKLVKKLDKLGCNTEYLGDPAYKQIPDHWFHCQQSTDITKMNIRIFYHINTPFDQLMKTLKL